jgi:riboflavin synthase
MFTGLIETVGRVVEVKPTSTGLRMRIATPFAADLRAGESVAVNGVCLTVTLAEGGEMHADIGPETARVTTLGSCQRDQPVNLERSMRADSRFGGHFVQGHVDGLGYVDDMRVEDDAHWLTIRYPEALAACLVRKGSIAVDGISLTVAGLDDGRFDVMIIPFTWEHTTLSALRVGDAVNLEGDMVGKYVARALELRSQPG